jgi:hypothetical protein
MKRQPRLSPRSNKLLRTVSIIGTGSYVPEGTDTEMTEPARSLSNMSANSNAWDAKGAAAPNVTFDWRCRVVSNQIIG